MQQTIYRCDGCQEEIGNKVHISIRLGSDSGITEPPAHDAGYWKVHRPESMGSFLHFCCPQHMAGYFQGVIATLGLGPKAAKKK
jgi:hypothetical protein